MAQIMLNSAQIPKSTTAPASRPFLFRTFAVLLGLLVVVASFYALRAWWHGGRGMSLSTSQYVVFLPVVFLLSLVHWLGIRLPRFLLMLSTCAALTGAAFAYTYREGDKGAFLVARLSGDEYEIQARQLREQIRGSLNLPNAPTVARYFRSLDRHSEARKLLRKDSDLHGIVWGSGGWLNVSMPDPKAISLSELGLATKLGRYGAVQIITNVPVFGLSFKPSDDTSRFLSTLFSGLMAKANPPSKTIAVDEVALLSAASMVAPWTSNAHKAVPMLLLGNYYLSKAIGDSQIEMGSLECALRAYRRGRVFSYRSGNPELGAALENNFAVALLLKSLYADLPGIEGDALASFNAAQSIMAAPNPYDAHSLALAVSRKNEIRLVRGIRAEKGPKGSHKHH